MVKWLFPLYKFVKRWRYGLYIYIAYELIGAIIAVVVFFYVK